MSGRGEKYVVKASAGQPDRRYTLIPYAMLMRRSVTTTPTRGVYIALLFDERCEKLCMTLNQGVSQFQERFGLRRSVNALRQAARLLSALLPVPKGFDVGTADLHATYPFGKGYEVGAIFSRDFKLSTFDESTAATFASSLSELLVAYERLPLEIARDPSLAGNLRNDVEDEDEFQKAVGRRAATPAEDEPVVDVPRPVPKRRGASIGNVYPRDPAVSAKAIRAAKSLCEAACETAPFTAASTGLPYVEAHHLIPLSEQDEFEFSLDVPANVVALCADCHAKIHLAVKATREPLITSLHAKRVARLSSCAINCDLSRLLRMYAGR